MARKNKTPYALLGLLSIQPMSGYEMKKWLDDYLSMFWSESWGQIYPTLHRLENDGAIERLSRESDSPTSKKVYRITEEGRIRLQRYLKLPVEENSLRNEMLLKLFFGRQVSPDVIERHLQTELLNHRKYEECQNQVDMDASKDCNDPVDARYWKYGLLYGQMFNRMVQEWCTAVLEDMKNWRNNNEN